MSMPRRKHPAPSLRRSATIFFALGDETRLALLARLGEGVRCSIARLAGGLPLTRQAITKHLRVLQATGLVRGVRQGRENLFELRPQPLEEARRSLDRISRLWDDALARLRARVEE
jgi:DNA-binding transcriptional ArsR family regulator